jgi:hypothetical protein
MSKRRHHWLTRLYPAAWRDRYGDEMDELLSERTSWREVADVAKAALIERMVQTVKPGTYAMRTLPGNVSVLVRRPSAIVPIAMSLGALAVIVVAVANTGPRQQADEGAAAHSWQILMAGQLPFIAWFALHWLKRDASAAFAVLCLQLFAFAAALLPVWLLGL